MNWEECRPLLRFFFFRSGITGVQVIGTFRGPVGLVLWAVGSA